MTVIHFPRANHSADDIEKAEALARGFLGLAKSAMPALQPHHPQAVLQAAFCVAIRALAPDLDPHGGVKASIAASLASDFPPELFDWVRKMWREAPDKIVDITSPPSHKT